MRLLVGFDGSDGGRDALELARVLASAAEGSIVVATVLFGGQLPVELSRLEGDDAGDAEALFEEARSVFSGIDELETRAYGGGSPAAILTELAEDEEEHFDAVVVGSPHRGPVGRVLIGSVARNLLNGGPRETFVAPRGYAEQPRDPFRTIAVGYDGSPEAKRALRSAEALAKHSNATLRLITVVSVPVLAGAVGYAPLPVPLDAEELLAEATTTVDLKLAVEQRRLDGSPAALLVKACEEDVDLLVLGSRGYGPLARVLLGSVSRRAAQDAPCPVLVVPRP